MGQQSSPVHPILACVGAVEAALKEVVAAEDHSRPLSDKEIAEALAGRGIRISRRTIVKYRDRLGILPSALRRGG